MMTCDGICVQDVSLSYERNLVLSGVTLSMRRGSVVTLVGPNGCGKTTLLKVINGFFRPSEGAIYVDGKDVFKLKSKELAKTIGHVAQTHKSSFPFSALEVVLTGRMPYISTFSSPSKKDVEKAEDALSLVGIVHLADRPYTQISGGERQLVMIARALAQEPKFLILDEPTSYLDFKNQVHVLKMIRDLARKGELTVVMTLHDPNHALMFSDEVVLLRRLDQTRDWTEGKRTGGPKRGRKDGARVGTSVGTSANTGVETRASTSVKTRVSAEGISRGITRGISRMDARLGADEKTSSWNVMGNSYGEKVEFAGNVVAHGPSADVMTPRNIKEAYGVDVEVLAHKGRRILLPI